MRQVWMFAAACPIVLWPGPAVGQTRAQLEAQYADECSIPTDDPDVRDSCEFLASLIGKKGVTFTGDYPAIPAPKGLSVSAAHYYALYSDHCAVPKPTGTAAQCNEWKKKVEDASSMVKFGLKSRPSPPPPSNPSTKRCDGCPAKRAQ